MFNVLSSNSWFWGTGESAHKKKHLDRFIRFRRAQTDWAIPSVRESHICAVHAMRNLKEKNEERRSEWLSAVWQIASGYTAYDTAYSLF